MEYTKLREMSPEQEQNLALAASQPDLPESKETFRMAEAGKFIKLHGPTPKLFESVSAGKAAALGAEQGLSFGLSDEAAGVGSSVSELVHPSSEEGFLPSLKTLPKRLKDAYTLGREDERKSIKSAKAEHPWAYGAANVGGSALSSFAPVGILGKSAQAAKWMQTAKGAGVLGALEGAVRGVGETEDLLSAQGALDIGKGAIIGGVTAGLSQAALNKAAKWFRRSPKATEAKAPVIEEPPLGTELSEVEDQLEEFASELPQIKTPKNLEPTVTPRDSELAALGGHTKPKAGEAASEVAYARENAGRLFDENRIHLDPTQKNNLAQVVWKDYQATQKRLRVYENETGKILDGVVIDPNDAAAPIRDEIGRLSGRLYSPDNEGSLLVLTKYLRGADEEGYAIRGILDGPVDAKDLRNLIRDIRSGNVSAYKGGRELPLKAKELKAVAERLNSVLKKAVATSKGKKAAEAYEALMKPYAEDMGAFTTLKKAWQVDRLGPSRDTWYDQWTLHKLQKVVDGDRSAANATAKALVHIGNRNGHDYLQIVKDNFVLNELFPEMTTGIDRGTWTRTTGRAASAVLKGAQGRVLSAGREVAEAVSEAATPIRHELMKKLIQQEGGLTRAELSKVQKGLLSAIHASQAVGRTPSKVRSFGEYVSRKAAASGIPLGLAGAVQGMNEGRQ